MFSRITTSGMMRNMQTYPSIDCTAKQRSMRLLALQSRAILLFDGQDETLPFNDYSTFKECFSDKESPSPQNPNAPAGSAFPELFDLYLIPGYRQILGAIYKNRVHGMQERSYSTAVRNSAEKKEFLRARSAYARQQLPLQNGNGKGILYQKDL